MSEYAESASEWVDSGRRTVGDGVAVVELVERYERFLLVVTAARAGTPTARAQLARSAVGALAAASAILDGFVVERWPIVGAGLAVGVCAAELGVALGGLDADEVVAGLISWADRRHRAGALSDGEHARMLALIAAA